MAFSDAKVDPKVARISDATIKGNVKTAINTAHTNLYAQVVTSAGRSATGAAWIDVEDKLLELAEQVAEELTH